MNINRYIIDMKWDLIWFVDDSLGHNYQFNDLNLVMRPIDTDGLNDQIAHEFRSREAPRRKLRPTF